MKKENQPGNYQLKADLEGNYLIDKEHKATKRLGIFYAPSGGSVHKVARLIKQKLVDLQPDLFVISDVTPLRFWKAHPAPPPPRPSCWRCRSRCSHIPQIPSVPAEAPV